MSRMKGADVPDDRIVEEYQRLGSSPEVARLLGVTERRIVLLLRKRGVPRDGLERYRQGAQRWPESVQKEILQLHQSGRSIQSLREEFGGTDYSIRTAIERQGGEIASGVTSRRQVSDDEAARMHVLYEEGLSQDDIAEAVGFSQPVVSRVLRERGVAMRRGPRRKEKHGNWTGGRMLTDQGYVLVHLENDDPLVVMRNRQGYVLEHRIVMARSLGRPLAAHETVHHKDGDRAHNTLENLQLRAGRHGKGSAMVCLDCGSHNVGHVELG